LRAPPAFGRARAAVLYKNVGRDLVLALKMADRTWIAPSLGAWMARAGRELLADADIIGPVPLYR
jgi:predicted amidophosphoribosyltransferase